LNKGNDTYWANQVEVQRLAASGIRAHVRGDDKRAAARELLAGLLLELDQRGGPGRVPGDVEHRSQSLPQPSRRGPRQKQTGDSATAHDAYRKLVALSKSVGPARPELGEARSYLTN
jgi:hypothetical protein